MVEKLTFTVPRDCENMRAQSFLRNRCRLSSRMITRLKREKDGILMDGKILRTVDKVRAGALVELNLPDEKISVLPVAGKLEILYEDGYILIVNKPPFMPVHPVKQHRTDTLANITAFYSMQKGENYVFRAVNRLDKDTSGAVLIAKDGFTVNGVKNNISKTYYAFCEGALESDGTVDRPIKLKEDSKMVREVAPDGAAAVTHYKILKRFNDYSFLEITLETGRTHQIRCHMSYLGYPLLGDDLYGGSLSRINRQALHCGRMELTHPVSGKRISVFAELPDDMKKLLDENKND